MIKFKILFFEQRSYIYVSLIFLALMSFALSYALLSVFSFLLVLFYFIDEKSKIISKLKGVKTNKIVLLYILFFSCQLIGLIYSSNLDYGLKRINTLLPLLFLPAIIYTEELNKHLLYKALSFLRLFLLLVFFYFLIIHVIVEERALHTYVLYVLIEKLGISQFYMIFIMTIPILFTLDELFNRKQVLLNIFILALWLFFVFLLTNKTALVMLFLIFTIRLMDFLKEGAHFLS